MDQFIEIERIRYPSFIDTDIDIIKRDTDYSKGFVSVKFKRSFTILTTEETKFGPLVTVGFEFTPKEWKEFSKVMDRKIKIIEEN